jgi:hypothetical protein
MTSGGKAFLLLLFLLASLGGWTSCKRSQELQAELQAAKAGCEEMVETARRSAETQAAGLQAQLERDRAATASDPQKWFAVFSRSVAERPFVARLKVRWIANFKLQYELKEGQTLLGGRRVEEQQRTDWQETVSSAGFLLGRRSNFLFGLVQIPVNDPAVLDPGDRFWYPPRSAEVEVPFDLNPMAEYALSAGWVEVETEVLAGCGAGPATIVYAWRTEKLIALVIGCEATYPGPDITLFPYEGYGRWTRLADQEIAFPLMTPAGGVAMAWMRLDRKYGESGMTRTGIGMPASVGPTFLPLEEAHEPVLHSMIFQTDATEQVWFPFWAVRNQLASARQSLDLDRALGVSWPVAYDPDLRTKMLPSYQSLINLNEEYELPGLFPPQMQSSTGG